MDNNGGCDWTGHGGVRDGQPLHPDLTAVWRLAFHMLDSFTW